MYCINCGSEIIKGAKFCFNCGSKLDDIMAMVGAKTESDSSPEVNLDSDNQEESCYWSKVYGHHQYIEYKGYIYSVVPKFDVLGYNSSECTDEDCDKYGARVKKWSIVRFSKNSSFIEVIKEIQECVGKESYHFDKDTIGAIPFFIRDNKIYYHRYYQLELDSEHRGAFVDIISLDIDTKEETKERIQLGSFEDEVCGFIKSDLGGVIIHSDYNYDECAGLFVSRINSKEKKYLGKNVIFEAYNDKYLYYTTTDGWRDFYVLDLNSFEVRNLCLEIPELSREGIRVNPDKKLIYQYFEERDNCRAVLWNLQNEIVGEVKKPEILNSVIYHSIDYVRSDGTGNYYNGEYMIVKIDPEDVGIGEKYGIILFDNDGNKLDEWMNVKNNNYISRMAFRFMLPSALSISYELVDKNGIQVDFSNKPQGRKEWHDRILYIEDKKIVDSGLEFCSYYEG